MPASARALLTAVAGLGALAVPEAARAASCDVCDQTRMCAGGSACLAGLPETTAGRCADPCPTPSAPFGGCPTNFTCVPLTNGSRVCVPRSDDCTNLTNYTEAQFGQTCTTQSCVSPALCVGFCTLECTGWPNQGSCPSPYVCGRYGTGANRSYFCGILTSEGEVCQDGSACTVGYCLRSGTGATATCYRDCASTRTCGSGQTCMDVNLQSGDTISVCNPPMTGGGGDAGVVPPRDSGVTPPRDAGFRDATTGVDLGFEEFDAGFPEEDTGAGPPRDSGSPPRDTGVGPGGDTGTGPGPDTGVVGPGGDSGTTGRDGSTSGADGAVTARDATTSTNTGGRRGGGAPAAHTGGCGCAAAGADTGRNESVLSAAMLLALGAVLARRRRSSAR